MNLKRIDERVTVLEQRNNGAWQIWTQSLDNEDIFTLELPDGKVLTMSADELDEHEKQANIIRIEYDKNWRDTEPPPEA